MLIMSPNTLFVLFVSMLILKGIDGCFKESQNVTIRLTKGIPFYQECLCEENGYNGRHLKWLDSHNQEIDVKRPGTDQKAYTERQNNRVNLYIPMVTKSVSGLYRCVTNFEGQDYSQNFYIEAYEPVTINPPEEQFVLLGNRSLVKCKVHAEDMSKILISWSKVDSDGTLTDITSNDKYDITHDGLYINEVVEEDKGIYSCSAFDKETMDEVDKDIYVKISTIPVIKDIKAKNTTLIVGGVLALHCIADGIPHPEYIWRRTDKEVQDNPRWKTNTNGLMIEHVLPEDQGTYECVAQSPYGVATKSVNITVMYPPKILSFSSITAVEGTTVQLVCNAAGRPAPNISIIFIGPDDDESKEFDENDIMENLQFLNVKRSHAGIYVCNASNEVNYTKEEMYLSVEYKPHFEVRTEIVWGWEGQVVNLSCFTEGVPKPDIWWRYLGEEESTAKQVEINEFLSTTFKNSPYIPINVSEMPVSLYGVYECTAANHLGGDKKLIHFKEGHIPPSTTRIRNMTITATSVTLYLDDPDLFEGPSILGYIAEYDVLDTYNVTNIHKNRTWSIDRPFILENLKPNTTYMIRIAAINLVGYSNWTEYITFDTGEPSAPNAPIWDVGEEEFEYNLVNVTDTTRKIGWIQPDSNGAPVDYYTLKYCTDDESPEHCEEQKVLSNEELKVNLDMLDHNTTYHIILTAHNQIGNSNSTDLYITTPAKLIAPVPRLSAGVLIGISIVVVFICLVILDLLLLLWKRQGVMATCCCRKKKSKDEDNLQTRDKKGLLKDTRDETEKDNRPREFEYDKTTGIITGKHSAV